VESQKKLLENWRKMKRSQMKRKIHQRRMKRSGLGKWKRYSELHYMKVWVGHRQALEVHRMVLEARRMVLEARMMVLEACTIALVSGA